MRTYTINDAKAAQAAMKLVIRDINRQIKRQMSGIESQLAVRAYRVANVIRDKEQIVLTGKRHGRLYAMPNGSGWKYWASAPGESPAKRTGAFHIGWGTFATIERHGKTIRLFSGIQSRLKVKGGYLLGDLLEEGTSRMKPRPYKVKVKDKAMNEAIRIYNRPYRG
jgi:hypothetical protein